jgi:hypothetical protein
MIHIKYFELFETANPITLIDIPDPLKVMEEFMEVLDLPRQNDDGFLMGSGEVSYQDTIMGKRYETGYRWIKENPEILELPQVKALMGEWLIMGIEFEQNGDILVTYEPMSKKDWDRGDYDDSGMDYEEYIETFGQ